MSINPSDLNSFIQTYGGVHTYIGLDEDGDGLHVACLALEAMGFIERSTDEEHHVFWVSVGKDTS